MKHDPGNYQHITKTTVQIAKDLPRQPLSNKIGFLVKQCDTV